jgi:hypothetical protein
MDFMNWSSWKTTPATTMSLAARGVFGATGTVSCFPAGAAGAAVLAAGVAQAVRTIVKATRIHITENKRLLNMLFSFNIFIGLWILGKLYRLFVPLILLSQLEINISINLEQ